MKPIQPNQFLARLNKWASLDVYHADVEEVASRVAGMSARARRKGLFLAETILRSRAAQRSDRVRVAAVKAIVALLPESLHNVERWLSHRGDRAYEVHFSFFCFLDAAREVQRLRRCEDQILEMVAEYLQGVKSDSAQAAWMAGDLLGDHWDSQRALPVLLKQAIHARFVAGRYGALHGLSQYVDSDSVAPESRQAVAKVLRQIATRDRSRRMRAAARRILQHRTY